MRREGKTFNPVKVVRDELPINKEMRMRAMARADRLAKVGLTAFSPARKVQVSGCTYERQPILAEGLPLPGQTIGGGVAPAGAITTANVGYMTTDGKFPFYGTRTLQAMERHVMAQQRCYEKAGTNMRKLVRCDEVPVKTGGVLALLSRKGKSS